MATKNTVSADKNAELALAAHKQQSKDAKSAHDSSIENMMGMTKVITINKGTPKEYSLTLRFPGVARAMEIEDMSNDQYGNTAFSQFMQLVIQDVIVSPKIKSLDFWNEHAGFSEVAVQALRFLNAGLEGNLDAFRAEA